MLIYVNLLDFDQKKYNITEKMYIFAIQNRRGKLIITGSRQI